MRSSLHPPRPFGSLLLAAAATLTPIHVQAQSSSSNISDAPQPVQSTSSFTNFIHNLHPQTSISLGTFAQLTPTRSEDALGLSSLLTNGASPTIGVLGTFRQQFRPWLGYSLNIGYTRIVERYTGQVRYFGNYDFAGKADMCEISLSYLARKQITRRMSGFFELGAGKLAFVPIYSKPHLPIESNLPGFGGLTTYRPEGVAGFGVQVHLANSFGLRAEYRGLLYKSPTFGSGTEITTVTSEPTLSLNYSFGHK